MLSASLFERFLKVFHGKRTNEFQQQSNLVPHSQRKFTQNLFFSCLLLLLRLLLFFLFASISMTCHRLCCRLWCWSFTNFSSFSFSSFFFIFRCCCCNWRKTIFHQLDYSIKIVSWKWNGLHWQINEWIFGETLCLCARHTCMVHISSFFSVAVRFIIFHFLFSRSWATQHQNFAESCRVDFNFWQMLVVCIRASPNFIACFWLICNRVSHHMLYNNGIGAQWHGWKWDEERERNPFSFSTRVHIVFKFIFKLSMFAMLHKTIRQMKKKKKTIEKERRKNKSSLRSNQKKIDLNTFGKIHYTQVFFRLCFSICFYTLFELFPT